MDADKSKQLHQILECTEELIESDSDCSDVDEIVLGLVEVAEMVAKMPNKRKKRVWMKPWRFSRLEKGSFKFLNKDLKEDPLSYQNFVRMNKSKFDFLLELIRQDLEKTDTHMRTAVSAAEKFALTLRFLATGESYKSLNYQTRLSVAFISQTVPTVCEVLWRHLQGTYLKFSSSSQEWETISREFAVKWQFPNCLGALDGKHIQFRPSRDEGAFYHNYKGTNSIILMALVDANLRFVFVDVGCNGRTNDAGVLQQCKLRHILDNEEQLPRDTVVGNSGCLPYVIVADDAFPLQRHIMKPYPYHTNSEQKKIFNIRLSRARHVVEHAFGILSNRFMVFQKPINLKVDTMEAITKACCCLHNFLSNDKENNIGLHPEINAPPETSSASSSGQYNPRKGDAENVRQKFMQYFNEEGKLDWQYSKIK